MALMVILRKLHKVNTDYNKEEYCIQFKFRDADLFFLLSVVVKGER